MSGGGAPKTLETLLLTEYLSQLQTNKATELLPIRSPYEERLLHTNIVRDAEPYHPPQELLKAKLWEKIRLTRDQQGRSSSRARNTPVRAKEKALPYQYKDVESCNRDRARDDDSFVQNRSRNRNVSTSQLSPSSHGSIHRSLDIEENNQSDSSVDGDNHGENRKRARRKPERQTRNSDRIKSSKELLTIDATHKRYSRPNSASVASLDTTENRKKEKTQTVKSRSTTPNRTFAPPIPAFDKGDLQINESEWSTSTLSTRVDEEKYFRDSSQTSSGEEHKSTDKERRNWDRDAQNFGVNSNHKKRKKKLPTYLKVARPIVVLAYKNGNRDISARVSAFKLDQLLEECTNRLHLPSFAKRVFALDGTEIFSTKHLKGEDEVYVSMGEAFNDPRKIYKYPRSNEKMCKWGIDGLSLPEKRGKKPTESKLSSEFENRNLRKKRRFHVFSNGNGHSATEVVEETANLLGFLNTCTLVLQFNSPAREVFLWDGTRVTNLLAVPEMDYFPVQGKLKPLSISYGPLWVSKGENLSPSGVGTYLRILLRSLNQRYKTVKNYQEQLLAADEGDHDAVSLKTILSMKETEVKEALQLAENEISALQKDVQKNQKRLNVVRPEEDQEKVEGSRYTQKHIQTYKGETEKGLKLELYENGEEKSMTRTVFDLAVAQRIHKVNPMKAFHLLLDHVSEALCNASLTSRSKGALVHRLFNEEAKDIKDIRCLEPNQKLWASRGEDWIEPTSHVLSVRFHQVKCFQYEGTNERFYKAEEYVGNIFENLDKKTVVPWKCIEGLPEDEILVMKISKPEESPPKRREGTTRPRSSYQRRMISQDNEEADDDEGLYNYEEDEEHPLSGEDSFEQENNVLPSLPEQRLYDISDLPLLQHAQNRGICLLPEVCISQKSMSNAHLQGNDLNKHPSKGPIEPQAWSQWLLNRQGEICLKYMPFVCLTVFTQWPIKFAPENANPSGKDSKAKKNDKVKKEWSDEGTYMNGCYITLAARKGATNQKWKFTKDGLVVSEADEELALAYIGGKINFGETVLPSQNLEEIKNYPYCLHPFVGVFSRNSSLSNFRWGIKQEKFDLMCQWKNNSGVTNPQWNKWALSWPVDENGEWNSRFKWPMEGCFMPNAPPLYQRNRKIKIPKRLRALKNGERDISKAVLISGPDLSRLVKGSRSDNHRLPTSTYPKDDQSQASLPDDSLHNPHCSDMTLLQLEMQSFLCSATGILGMNQAAQRLFDSRGKEHATLKDLESDELVFVSAGENWIDPTLKKDELRQRAALNRIAEDVQKMDHFLQLRNTKRLVASIAPFLDIGAHLVVSHLPTTHKTKKQGQSKESLQSSESGSQDEELGDQRNGSLSAHERSHQRSDEMLQEKEKFKWPWERLVNSGVEQEADENRRKQNGLEDGDKFDCNERSDQNFKLPSKSPRLDTKNLCRFGFDDGYIYCLAETNLVLAVTQGEGSQMGVVLEKRKYESANQKWIVQPNGYIQCKYRSNHVLTIRMPRPSPTVIHSKLTYVGTPITVQQQHTSQFGTANQKFSFDETTGTIYCFASNVLDAEVTVANSLNICTFSVTREPIDQPGYLVYLPTNKSKVKGLRVCLPCARSLRGKYKLLKFSEGAVDFSCAFGKRNEFNLKEPGSFSWYTTQVSSSSREGSRVYSEEIGEDNDEIQDVPYVDLSTNRAECTVQEWHEVIEKMRDGLSVKQAVRLPSVAKDADWHRGVRVLAYRNGEGRLGDSVVIVGKTIEEIMDQVTKRLAYRWAVRLLFVEDGTPIPNIMSLYAWYRLNRDKVAQRNIEMRSGKPPKEVEEMRQIERSLNSIEGESTNELETVNGKTENLTEESSAKGKKTTSKELKACLSEERGCYEIGRQSTRHTKLYEFSIAIRRIHRLEKVISTVSSQGMKTMYCLVTSLFDIELNSEPFYSEDSYEPDVTTIILSGTVRNLRTFFRHSFTKLTIKLYKLESVSSPGNTQDLSDTLGSGTSVNEFQLGDCLAMCEASLTDLIPVDLDEELISPISMESIYSLRSIVGTNDSNKKYTYVPLMSPSGSEAKISLELRLQLSSEQDLPPPQGYQESSDSDTTVDTNGHYVRKTIKPSGDSRNKHSSPTNTSKTQKISSQNDMHSDESDIEESAPPKGPVKFDEDTEEAREDFIQMATNVTLEVWTSCGEPFVPLKTVNNNYKRILKRSLHTAPIIHEKDMQRHILQQMAARRMEHQQRGDYIATQDPDNPVVIHGNWNLVPRQEKEQKNRVDALEIELDSVRKTHPMPSRSKPNVDLRRGLYKQPNLKRICVYLNGDSSKAVVHVWGDNMFQLLENAAMRLRCQQKPNKLFYYPDGKEVPSFDAINRDDLLCLSMGEPFCPPKDRRDHIEIKANWGRAQRRFGPKSTDVNILIRPQTLSKLGVDPFGPPAGYVKHNPPAFENKRVLVYAEGQKLNSAVTIWGKGLEDLLQHARQKLKLRSRIQCFRYQSSGELVSSVDKLVRDDVLIACTSFNRTPNSAARSSSRSARTKGPLLTASNVQ